MTKIAFGHIIHGRDQMNIVLEQYLAPICALERANNIAQAIALGAGNPASIARDMLKNSGLNDPATVAIEVARAWAAAIARRRRKPRASDIIRIR
jgi:hypothetical protein